MVVDILYVNMFLLCKKLGRWFLSLPYDYDETIVRVNYVQKNSKLVPMGFSHVKLC